jgi:hypothetical protein
MTMYGTYAKMSFWLAPLVLLTGCAVAVPPSQQYHASAQTVGTVTDPLEALVVLERSLKDSSSPCAWGTTKPTFAVSGTTLQFACRDGSQQRVRYAEAPEATVISNDPTCPVMACIRLAEHKGATGGLTLYASGWATAKEVANAWYVLAQPRHLHDPATDKAFVEAVTRYRAEPQSYAETLRRVQIQVESTLKDHRVPEAARLYREILTSAVGWPEGHFNLALLYGELELYPEAITEIRRYLFLVPTAPDARAAQDKIYEWELKAK